ncbi:MAG: 2-oxoacid:acceptor oxidoreductase subunit alpha [Bdellovibrionaceae bacterium]|nr:2-oxoacid:acceptor oxidoreductase subunit alpha [Pseudobdellovibrionaceae bacterium]MDW8189993.1 2-oxoacid:acceptor oxidoreductase subunit alpha [Pseudobdellovibrionaceae bacterium]
MIQANLRLMWGSVDGFLIFDFSGKLLQIGMKGVGLRNSMGHLVHNPSWEDQEINNFVIQVATVNGSGSQSANTILLKTLFRMGIPVAGKNVFPSNIAGLPTWFWIRASSKGYQARRERPNICIAMNPQTFKEDYALVLPGGYFLYNKDIPWPQQLNKRADITEIPFPVRELVDQVTQQIRIKKLLANMVYVGVLAELLGLDQECLEKSVMDQFRGKESVLESNFQTYQKGAAFAQQHLKDVTFRYKAQLVKDGNRDKIIIDGNSASALGLIDGGATFGAWYPITPSTSLVEAFAKYAPALRPKNQKTYVLMQAEDELSAVSMAIGAGWQGARAFTATSGPGLSLMQEAVGYAYYGEIPIVIWDVQRVGPSTGMPTRTAQGDILSAVFASHGDTKHPILLPGNPKECYDFGQMAFDIAEELQTPVFVLSDLDLGMNLWSVDRFTRCRQPFRRGRVLDVAALEERQNFRRYADEIGDGVAFRTLPGTPHPLAAYFTRGSGHNVAAGYTEKGGEYQEVVDRIAKKWLKAKTLVPKPVVHKESSAIGVIFYGSSEPAVTEALDLLRKEQSFSISTLRVRAIPFTDEVEQFISDHDRVYVVDLNRDGQLLSLLRMEFGQFCSRFLSIRHYDGTPITAETVYEPILVTENNRL